MAPPCVRKSGINEDTWTVPFLKATRLYKKNALWWRKHRWNIKGHWTLIWFFFSVTVTKLNISKYMSLIYHIFVAQVYLIKVYTRFLSTIEKKCRYYRCLCLCLICIVHIHFNVPSWGFCFIQGVLGYNFIYIIYAEYFNFIIIKWFICRKYFICYSISIWQVKLFLQFQIVVQPWSFVS